MITSTTTSAQLQTDFVGKYDLKGKVAVITGGGKGLGKTLTEYLLSAGMKVAICGRTKSTIDNTVTELANQYAQNIIGMVCDVSDSKQVDNFKAFVLETLGQVDVLINNSGIGKDTLIWETAEEDWDAVMDTNVKGAYLMCRAFVPKMIKHKQGFILNIASQAAIHGYSHAGVYCASKFALLGLGKSLQEEVRDHNIHVHTLNPALIQSQKQDDEVVDEGLIQNQDLARMALFLLQSPRRLKIDNIGMWGF